MERGVGILIKENTSWRGLGRLNHGRNLKGGRFWLSIIRASLCGRP